MRRHAGPSAVMRHRAVRAEAGGAATEPAPSTIRRGSRASAYLVRPVTEPVDRAAVDQGREHPHAGPEGLPDGGERQDDVQLALDGLDEARVQPEGKGHRRRPSVQPEGKGHRRRPSVQPEGEGHRRRPGVQPEGEGHRRRPGVQPEGEGHRRRPGVQPEGEGHRRRPSVQPEGEGHRRRPSDPGGSEGPKDTRGTAGSLFPKFQCKFQIIGFSYHTAQLPGHLLEPFVNCGICLARVEMQAQTSAHPVTMLVPLCHAGGEQRAGTLKSLEATLQAFVLRK